MNWVPLSKTAHARKALKKKENFDFVKNVTLVQLYNFEIQQAVSYLPIMFVKNGDLLNLCGVLGLSKDENLFVNTENKWDVYYFPAAFKSYPFRTVKTADGKYAILFLEESGLIVDEALGEPLFDEQGQETETLRHYTQLLAQMEQSNAASSKISSLLMELELLQPFELKVSAQSGTSHLVEGLHSVDIKRFKELDEEDYRKLRQHNAIEIIYAHLFSLSCFNKLIGRKNHRDQLDRGLKDIGAKIFEEKDEELNFNF